MKKIFIILLMFILSTNFLTCYASSEGDFDYGVDPADKSGFNETATIITHDNEKGTNKTISTTIDFVPLFNRTIIVPIKGEISGLIRTICKFWTGGYDSSALYLNTNCENNSNYNLTLVTDNDSLSATSEMGNVNILNIPQGEFSAYIDNNDDHELSCNMFLFGYGLDTTPEEGFNISLKCYDSSETSMSSWLKPSIGVLGSAVFATLLRCLKF